MDPRKVLNLYRRGVFLNPQNSHFLRGQDSQGDVFFKPKVLLGFLKATKKGLFRTFQPVFAAFSKLL